MRTLAILPAIAMIMLIASSANALPICVSDGHYECQNGGVACADVDGTTDSTCDGLVCVAAGPEVHDSIGAHTGQC